MCKIELSVIYELMESIFGSDFQQCGNNSLRTTEGAHRAEQWHVDPPVWFPLPPGMDRHDPRIEMPVFWLTVQLAFTDIGGGRRTCIMVGQTRMATGKYVSKTWHVRATCQVRARS